MKAQKEYNLYHSAMTDLHIYRKLYVSSGGPITPEDTLIIENMEVPPGATMIYFVVKAEHYIDDVHNVVQVPEDYEIISPIFKIRGRAREFWEKKCKKEGKEPWFNYRLQPFYCDLHIK